MIAVKTIRTGTAPMSAPAAKPPPKLVAHEASNDDRAPAGAGLSHESDRQREVRPEIALEPGPGCSMGKRLAEIVTVPRETN